MKVPKHATSPKPGPQVNPADETPTVFQLAQLAASFLTGQTFTPAAVKQAVSRASLLWEVAHSGVIELQDSRKRRAGIKDLESELPKILSDWPRDSDGVALTIPYKQGIDAMFPRDKATSRDGLMLELLDFIAQCKQTDPELGRNNWRRLKAAGFSFEEFHNISHTVRAWRAERQSSANRSNGRKGARQKKELAS